MAASFCVVSQQEAIINIRNNDEHCLGYALQYFIERANLPKRNKHCVCINTFKEEIFNRHHLATISYPIATNNVNLCKDSIQININAFSCFDDIGNTRYPLVVNRINYECVVNLLYCKNHYALITSIPRLFLNITKHENQKHFCF